MLGRPSIYSDDLAALICQRLIEGLPITRICSDIEMPDVKTVFNWMQTRPDFLQMYTRARDIQADVFVAQTIDIADNPLIGVKTVESEKDGLKTYTGDNVERSKLMIYGRQWSAARIAPLKYGDRMAVQNLDERGQPTRPGITVIIDGAPSPVSVPAGKVLDIKASPQEGEE